jgi:hypothetical protein
MEIGIPEIQRELRDCFTASLPQKYGEVLGALLTEVVAYSPRERLDPAHLRATLDANGAAIVNALLANRVTESTMLAIRTQMIGSALLGDKAGVVRWATEGLSRCQRIGGHWTKTGPQWQLVLDDPERLMLYARQVKYFMNQV